MNDGFNIADAVALVIVLACIILGIRRGLIGQLAQLASITLLVVSVRFGFTPCEVWIEKTAGMGPFFSRVTALIAVIVIPLALVLLVRRLFAGRVRLPVISGIDRVGGAIGGLIGGTLFVLTVFFALAILPKPYSPDVTGKDSWLGRRVAAVENDLIGVVTQRVDSAESAILRARANKAGRREKWDE